MPTAEIRVRGTDPQVRLRILQRLGLGTEVEIGQCLEPAGNGLGALGFPCLGLVGDVLGELFGQVVGGIVFADVLNCVVHCAGLVRYGRYARDTHSLLTNSEDGPFGKLIRVSLDQLRHQHNASGSGYIR